MLVDAHVHMDRYGDRLSEAIRQMEHHQMLTVAVSMDIPSYLRTVEISANCDYLIPSFGVHPWKAERYADRLGELDSYLKDTPLIGEAGLDFFWVTDTKKHAAQRIVFEYQCHWAQRLSKPMNLHTKGAEREVVDTLRRFRIRKSIIHWYSGPLNLIEPYLSLGCYFTIGVEVLISDSIEEIAKEIPIDRLLLETDNPDGYKWLTKQEGMPALLIKVLEKVAFLRRMDKLELENHLARNWRDFAQGIVY